MAPRSTRLERRLFVDRAWEQYVRDGREPAGIGEEISRSWQRARESHRIDPSATRPALILSADALEERCRRDETLRFASGVIRDFSDRLSLSDHALAYFDAEGWMLSVDGDRAVVDRLEEISFRPGTNWTEESAGTNGPGTALATGKAVEVFASEHFVTAWQPWSCAAAPVLTPGGSKPLGVVDITGPWEVRRRQALFAVKAIARAIQERVGAAVSVREEVVRYAFRTAHEHGEPVVAVDSHGRVIAVNDAAARRRLVDRGALPPGMREALLRALGSRTASADADIRLDWPEGLPVLASQVRYDGATVGAILRVSARSAPLRASARPAARYDFSRILGQSEPLRSAVELARTAARNELPVVVSGESGTGKELFAHAIHSASRRGGGPFVAVNCGSIPAEMVEAELFGYEAGTFTGAKRDGNPGRFEDATGGTLFLDEVSELPHPAQTALLRVLQEKEVVRLGGSTPRHVDVRVVAATNKPLPEEVRARRFRADLYYRLNVLSISVPRLRERGDDIALLAQVFLGEAEAEVGRPDLTLSEDALDALKAEDWPGNVRQLKNVILRAAATAPRSEITSDDLLIDPAPAAAAPAPQAAAPGAATGRPRGEVVVLQRDALLAAVDGCGWNVARAARELGVSRMTLYRWMTRYGISRLPSSSS